MPVWQDSAWFTYVAVIIWFPEDIESARQGTGIVEGPMRKMMVMQTFFSIGMITDFSKLKGMGI